MEVDLASMIDASRFAHGIQHRGGSLDESSHECLWETGDVVCVLWAGSPAARHDIYDDAATVDNEDGRYNNPYRTSPIISNYHSRTIHLFIGYSFSTASSSA